MEVFLTLFELGNLELFLFALEESDLLGLVNDGLENDDFLGIRPESSDQLVYFVDVELGEPLVGLDESRFFPELRMSEEDLEFSLETDDEELVPFEIRHEEVQGDVLNVEEARVEFFPDPQLQLHVSLLLLIQFKHVVVEEILDLEVLVEVFVHFLFEVVQHFLVQHVFELADLHS